MPLTKNKPKPMVLVNNSPFLEYLIDLLKDNGICTIVCDENLNFVNLLIQVEGSNNDVSIHGSDYWTCDGNGIVLTRSYKNGLIELAAVYLGKNKINKNGQQVLASLDVSENKDIGKITVEYKARLIGEKEIKYGKTAISDEDLSSKPKEFVLYQNKPNPFDSTTTTIEYHLPVEAHVKLTVYNISGQQVAVLKNHVENIGRYTVIWDSSDMPSGIYLYRLKAGNFTETKKMLLLK